MLAATTRARRCFEQKGCGCRSTRRASSQELSKRLGSLLNGSLRWEQDGHAKEGRVQNILLWQRNGRGPELGVSEVIHESKERDSRQDGGRGRCCGGLITGVRGTREVYRDPDMDLGAYTVIGRRAGMRKGGKWRAAKKTNDGELA